MSFERDLSVFSVHLDEKWKAFMPAIGAATYDSIVFGSPVTGAPGQPVGIGNLRAGWQLLFPDEEHAEIVTKVPYAESNEDGIARPGGGPYIQRSPVGGRWSIALTRTNFDRLVDVIVGAP